MSKFFSFLSKRKPVQTFEEFNIKMRKKNTILVISILLFFVPIVLMVAAINIFGSGDVYDFVSKILMVPIYLGAAGFLYTLIVGARLKKIKIMLANRQCPACQFLIQHDNMVVIEELRRWEVKNVQRSNNFTHVYQTVHSKVSILCVCQKCGTKKEFVEQFRVEHWTDGCLDYSYGLDELVKKYFEGKNIQL